MPPDHDRQADDHHSTPDFFLVEQQHPAHERTALDEALVALFVRFAHLDDVTVHDRDHGIVSASAARFRDTDDSRRVVVVSHSDGSHRRFVLTRHRLAPGDDAPGSARGDGPRHGTGS